MGVFKLTSLPLLVETLCSLLTQIQERRPRAILSLAASETPNMTLYNNISIKVCLPQTTSVSIFQPAQVERQSAVPWTPVSCCWICFNSLKHIQQRHMMQTQALEHSVYHYSCLFIFWLCGCYWRFHTDQIKWVLICVSPWLLFFSGSVSEE